MASPDVRVPPPRVSKGALLFVRVAARAYLRFALGIGRVSVRGEEALLRVFQSALAGEAGVILAFQHACGDEPQILGWYFFNRLARAARRAGVRLARRPRAVFVYGYEVLRWGGGLSRFIMPRLGALPIYHSKVDSGGMARIYAALTEGLYPLALAPEGQVSYTQDAVPRLEPGVVRIGFGAAERLEKAGRARDVIVVPIAFRYRYGRGAERALERLLARAERLAGLKRAPRASFAERAERCREAMLRANEARYGLKDDGQRPFAARVDRVIDAAFSRAEGILGFAARGDHFNRMYELRQQCWDRVILPGVETLEGLPPLERALMDLRAGEAWHAGRHLELVDFAWYFRGDVPPDDAPLERRIEYAQNLWDFANRGMGGAYVDRRAVVPRHARISVGPPITLSDRLASYKRDKRAAVDAVLAEIKAAYEHPE
jgi:hypothetical protein